MRPPLNAGENLAHHAVAVADRHRFNEAPAERGGKLLGASTGDHDGGAASMRPPLNAGENAHVCPQQTKLCERLQ